MDVYTELPLYIVVHMFLCNPHFEDLNFDLRFTISVSIIIVKHYYKFTFKVLYSRLIPKDNTVLEIRILQTKTSSISFIRE